ncbi:cyclic-di-GMP-binding biofilm dispersal mediator protein [Kineococcus radiotolerans]|uniref:Cyclic-di-GMP-binding biofilm dispersal mediator protein n=1 Tax=Kineococcus radiotolerans TaxID=131568 RepID=A0A7W4XY35_KINRA|nr:SDR family oxidoreductase [Kineococcus radiotolerans]MBB2902117.1 cyclic-di-GMP-binding biofilm dispersal mediator protein [Kineococcus radiotolerans]
MSDLSGARVLVTGASGGLGGPVAARLAGAGARLVLSGRDATRLTGLGGHPVAADLRLPGEPERLVAEAVAHLGGLDGLVHAAGVVAFGPAEEADDELLDELFLADALGPIRLLREAVPHLRASGPGSFAVVLSAVVAERPQPGMAAYSAAKAAQSAFTLALAREVRREVRVLDVRPPHTETGLAQRPVAGTAPRLPRGLEPDAVAERIVRAIVDDERELPAAAFG